MTEPIARGVWAEDAEQAVLCATLFDSQALQMATELLRPSDFYADRHRHIFAALGRLASRGTTPDPITLADELARTGDLEAAGGKDYIGFLVDAVPTTAHVRYHAEIVLDAAKRRELADRLAEQSHALRAGTIAADDAAAQLQPMLDALAGGARADAFLSYDDVRIMDLPPLSFLVDGLLPRGGAAALYGAPGSGKSFLALDIALSVASGRPFLGRVVERAPVFYVAAEGLAGQPARVAAWKRRHGYDSLVGVHFFTEPVNLLDAGAVGKFLAAVRQSGQQPNLIVFDTLARCAVGGDENSAKDMGVLVDNVRRIQRATGACVLLLHHTGKQGDSERGSTALRGGMDTMLCVKADEDGGLSLLCDKQKDGRVIDPIRLRLDPEGESCVVVTAIYGLQSASVVVTASERSLLHSLQHSFLDHGATSTEWMAAAGVPPRTFFNARTRLVRRGYVYAPDSPRGGRYTLSDAGRSEVTATCHLTAA